MAQQATNVISLAGKPQRGQLIAFLRSTGRSFIGKVISSGSAKIGIEAIGLKQNTSIEAGQPLYEVTLLVTEDVLRQLNVEIPTAAIAEEPTVETVEAAPEVEQPLAA